MDLKSRLDEYESQIYELQDQVILAVFLTKMY